MTFPYEYSFVRPEATLSCTRDLLPRPLFRFWPREMTIECRLSKREKYA